MKIVVFQGGLGNQLFQYFFCLYVREHINENVRYIERKRGNNHNGLEIDKYFELDIKRAPWYYICYFRICERFNFHFPFKIKYVCEKDLEISNESFFIGYWQNKKFFEDYSIQIKSPALSAKNKTILTQILETDSIAIHVRRGDYLLPHYSSIYGNVCTPTYYREAIKLSQEKFPQGKFFVFSDDINWVSNNIILPNAIYVNWNTGENSFFDMFLMSNAKVNIIANSSFSFWAAYLNKQASFVIYPSKWYNSKYTPPPIFPLEWIGLPS